MKERMAGLALVLVAILLVACGPEPTAAPVRTLTVMTHDSFDVSEEVVAAFQEQCGCEVQFLRSGDAGLMLNQALLSKDNPLADVIYGVDNTFLTRALEGDMDSVKEYCERT